MNLLQASIANKINSHFKRQRKLMPRSFPVELFENDQELFVSDLVAIFKQRDKGFDEVMFRRLVHE